MQTIIDPTFAPEFKAVGAASAALSTTMADGNKYLLVSTTATWVAIGAAPTAAKANGSFYLPPNFPVVIMCRGGATKVAVLQDAAGGNCSLTLLL